MVDLETDLGPDLPLEVADNEAESRVETAPAIVEPTAVATIAAVMGATEEGAETTVISMPRHGVTPTGTPTIRANVVPITHEMV